MGFQVPFDGWNCSILIGGFKFEREIQYSNDDVTDT